MWYAGREGWRKKGEARRRRRCKDITVTVTDRRTDGQAVWQVHIGTDGQTNRICCAECAEGDYLTVGWRVCEGTGGVCICLFALVCLRMCVSCVWLCFLCVLTHVCLYVLCRYHTAGAKLSKPKSDSLYSTLCDILPFIFPLWLKSKSLLSLAQLSPLEVSLARNEALCIWIFSGDTDIKMICIRFFIYLFLNELCIVTSAVSLFLLQKCSTEFREPPPLCFCLDMRE